VEPRHLDNKPTNVWSSSSSNQRSKAKTTEEPLSTPQQPIGTPEQPIRTPNQQIRTPKEPHLYAVETHQYEKPFSAKQNIQQPRKVSWQRAYHAQEDIGNNSQNQENNWARTAFSSQNLCGILAKTQTKEDKKCVTYREGQVLLLISEFVQFVLILLCTCSKRK